MRDYKNLLTPDGLVIYNQPGVGLVVSAAEHNFMWSRWQREREALLVGDHFLDATKKVSRASTRATCRHVNTAARAGFCYDELRCIYCGAYMGEPVA